MAGRDTEGEEAPRGSLELFVRPNGVDRCRRRRLRRRRSRSCRAGPATGVAEADSLVARVLRPPLALSASVLSQPGAAEFRVGSKARRLGARVARLGREGRSSRRRRRARDGTPRPSCASSAGAATRRYVVIHCGGGEGTDTLRERLLADDTPSRTQRRAATRRPSTAGSSSAPTSAPRSTCSTSSHVGSTRPTGARAWRGAAPDVALRAERRLARARRAPGDRAAPATLDRARPSPTTVRIEHLAARAPPGHPALHPLPRPAHVQPEYLRAARRVGLPPPYCVASWDNLT